MNASIEQAFAAALATALAAHSPTPQVHAATVRAIQPTEVNFIVVHVADCTHDVGALYTAMVGIFVDTPVLSSAAGSPVFTVDHHRALVAAVESWMNGDLAALDAALLTTSSCARGGHWHEANREAHSQSHWITQITYRVGLRRTD